jgi:hypothetical protein
VFINEQRMSPRAPGSRNDPMLTDSVGERGPRPSCGTRKSAIFGVGVPSRVFVLSTAERDAKPTIADAQVETRARIRSERRC